MSNYITFLVALIFLSGCTDLSTIKRETPKVTGVVYDRDTMKPIPNVNVKVGPVISGSSYNHYITSLSEENGSFFIPAYHYLQEVERSELNKPIPPFAAIYFFHENYKPLNKSFSEYSLLDQKTDKNAPKYFDRNSYSLDMKKVYLTPKTTKD